MSNGFTLCSGCAELRQDKQAMRDDHAEFVRAVEIVAARFQAFHSAWNLKEVFAEIIALCDAELSGD
jgi:hypothetical protein